MEIHQLELEFGTANAVVCSLTPVPVRALIRHSRPRYQYHDHRKP